MKGDLHAQCFSQDSNLPDTSNGPLLFKRIMEFASTDSHRATTEATTTLVMMNPASSDYNIILINQAINNLFVLILQGPSAVIVTDDYRIHHTLQIYEKIRQPQEWASFVRLQRADQANNTLTNPRLLMRQAAAKYNSTLPPARKPKSSRCCPIR